jgi:hypothetical protein
MWLHHKIEKMAHIMTCELIFLPTSWNILYYMDEFHMELVYVEFFKVESGYLIFLVVVLLFFQT